MPRNVKANFKGKAKDINQAAVKSNIFYFIFFALFGTSVFLNQIPEPKKQAASVSAADSSDIASEFGEEIDSAEQPEDSIPEVTSSSSPRPTYLKLLKIKKQILPKLIAFSSFSYTDSIFNYFSDVQPVQIYIPRFSIFYETIEPKNISFPATEIFMQYSLKNIPKEAAPLISFFKLGENYWKRFLYIISSQKEETLSSVTYPVLNHLSETLCLEAIKKKELPLTVEVKEELRYFYKPFKKPTVSDEKVILFQECKTTENATE